jgi:hypothetical protein
MIARLCAVTATSKAVAAERNLSMKAVDAEVSA